MTKQLNIAPSPSGRSDAEQQEKIEGLMERFAQMPFLNHQDRALMILTMQGVKPASLIGLQHRASSKIVTAEEFTKRIRAIEECLEYSGLLYEKEIEEILEEDNETVFATSIDFAIAQTNEVLQFLCGAVESGDKKQLGLALGYPSSAVEEFSEKFDPADDRQYLTEEMRQSPEANFLFFRLSKAHAQEEFEVVKRWAEVIRVLCPTLYKQITSVARSMRATLHEAVGQKPGVLEEILHSPKTMEEIKMHDASLYDELVRYGRPIE